MKKLYKDKISQFQTIRLGIDYKINYLNRKISSKYNKNKK